VDLVLESRTVDCLRVEFGPWGFSDVQRVEKFCLVT
jgi:hypothetical protein